MQKGRKYLGGCLFLCDRSMKKDCSSSSSSSFPSYKIDDHFSLFERERRTIKQKVIVVQFIIKFVLVSLSLVFVESWLSRTTTIEFGNHDGDRNEIYQEQNTHTTIRWTFAFADEVFDQFPCNNIVCRWSFLLNDTPAFGSCIYHTYCEQDTPPITFSTFCRVDKNF